MAVYAYAEPMIQTAPGIVHRAAAEMLGSAALTAAVVGSGIAATNLTEDAGLQLLINAAATVLVLYALITVLSPLGGAHFNPVVSLADFAFGYRALRDVGPYVVVQIVGCVLGSMLANAMFDLPVVRWSSTDRVSPEHLLAEIVATAGLVSVIFGLARTGRSHLAAPVVAAYIGAAYFFTSSTSFANPAITIGRAFTDSFAGIAPTSVGCFIGAQLVGAAAGYVAVEWLTRRIPAAE
jgi:glycerol uptake facilitator-like aquaporin